MPRSEDLTLIAEHFDSFCAHADLVVLRKVIRKLGWSAFTDEAVAEFAEHYAWNAADRERRNAENRALAALSERPDHSEQEAAAA